MTLIGRPLQCDAEIGKPSAWHRCRRRAVIQVTRYLIDAHGACYFLYYCSRHKKRVENKPSCVIRQTIKEVL